MSLPQPYNNAFIDWPPNTGSGTPPIIPPYQPPGPGAMYATDSPPVLQGRVSTGNGGGSTPSSPDAGGQWDTVWDVLASVLPVALAAARGYVSGLASGSAPVVDTAVNLSVPTYKPVNYQSNPVSVSPITVHQPPRFGQQAMGKVAQLRAQADRVAVQQAHQRATHVLDQLAQAQGLPAYKDFHAQNGMAYPAPPEPGTLGIAQAQPQTDTAPWIPEDQRQIQANLQAAQKPKSWQALQAQSTQYPAAQFHSVQPIARHQPPVNVQAIYHDREHGPVNVWQKMQAGHVLSDNEMKQLFHTLDVQSYGAKNAVDREAAESYRYHAYKQLSHNIISHEKHAPEAKIYLNGVTAPSDIAYEVAWRDIQHFDKTDLHLSNAQTKAIIETLSQQEPNLPDLTPVTVAATALLAKGLGRILTPWAINQYAKRQAAKRIIRFEAKQLQKKYSKHAIEVGFHKPYNPRNAEEFKQLLIKFVKNPQTKEIVGSYRGTIPVKVYYNPYTNITVITGRDGKFITFWRSSLFQLEHLLKTGNIQ